MYKDLNKKQAKRFSKIDPLLTEFKQTQMPYVFRNVSFERFDLLSMIKDEKSLENIKAIINDYWDKSEDWVQCFILKTRKNFLNGRQKISTLVIEFDYETRLAYANYYELSVRLKNEKIENVIVLKDDRDQYKFYSKEILKTIENHYFKNNVKEELTL